MVDNEWTGDEVVDNELTGDQVVDNEDCWRSQLGPYIQDDKCNDNGIQMLTFYCREGYLLCGKLIV